MKKYDFIRKQITEAKEELKNNKQWKKALVHEYGLARTFKEHRQNQIINMVKMADVMIEHYTNIVKELETMLKEMQKIESE